MTRIAHVTDDYLPRLGGVETQVSGLAAHQAQAGHEVHVLTRTLSRGHVEAPGPTVHRGFPRSLRRVLLGGGFDVVHVHASFISPLGMAMAAAACSAGIPVVVTLHSMWPDSPTLVRPAGIGLRLSSRPIAWSAVSRTATGPLIRALGAGVPVDVLPNATDVGWWQERSAAPSAWAADDEVVVTSLMRFSQRKRPMPLIRAMREVHRLVGDDVRLRLVVAGDGPQLGRIRRAVKAHGMAGWVDFPGRISREQARDLLHASHVYVAPADLESFGIAALEARAAGLPVVAKSCGGVGEFVASGTEGLLVDTDHDLARAVAALVSDRALRDRMAAHNTAVAPRCTWDRALEHTESLYARAAAIAGRPVAVPGALR